MLRQLDNAKKFLRYRNYSEEAISKVLNGNFKNVTPMYKCISLMCDGVEFNPQKFDINNSHLEALVLFTDNLVSIKVSSNWELSTSVLTPGFKTTEHTKEFLEELKDFEDLKAFLIDIYQEYLYPFLTSDQCIDDAELRKWLNSNKNVEKIELINGKKLIVITNINNTVSISETKR